MRHMLLSHAELPARVSYRLAEVVGGSSTDTRLDTPFDCCMVADRVEEAQRSRVRRRLAGTMERSHCRRGACNLIHFCMCTVVTIVSSPTFSNLN